MGTPSYSVAVASKGVRATVLWNDFAAVRVREDGEGTDARKVSHYLLEGENVLKVWIERSKTLAPGESTRLIVRLTHGIMPDESTARTILEYRYDDATSPLPDDGRQLVCEHKLTPQKAFGAWEWEASPTYRNEDRPDVLAALRKLHAALARDDIEDFLAQNRKKLKELARGTGRDFDEVLQDQRNLFEHMLAAPIHGVRDLVEEDIVLESACHGRIVEAWLPNYQSPLRVIVMDGGMDVDVSFAKIDGEWWPIR